MRTHTSQVVSADQEVPTGISLPWQLLVGGLLLTAVVSLLFVRVCTQELPGANEWMRGVRHEKVGKVWYHCEPWIRRAFQADEDTHAQKAPRPLR